MRKRKVTTLFAVSFLLVFGKQNAEAADSTNYLSISSDNAGDMFHYGFNHIYPENSELVYLRRMVNKMRKDPTLKLKITSHGCSIGTDDANTRVSRLRANILEDYMMRHDIPKTRLIKEWKGEEEPLADNDTEHGRSLNRRSLVQLIRDNGDIEQGVNKPKAQLHHASSNNEIYAASSHQTPSSSHYSHTNTSSRNYAQNNHVSVVQSHSNSSYTNPRNITSNSHTASSIQQPRIHASSSPSYNTHQPVAGNIHTSSPVYSSPRPIKSAPLSSNSYVSSSQQHVNSNHAVSNHQNTTQYADTRLSQSSPASSGSHSVNSMDSKYHPVSDNRIMATDTPKDYVEIDVEEVYNELNPDLESKQGFEYATAAEANEAKYNQLADALNPEVEDALSFNEEETYSAPRTYEEQNASSKVLSESSIVRNNPSTVAKPNIPADSRKINQPKPKPILVSQNNENIVTSNQGVEDVMINNNSSHLPKEEMNTSVLSDTNISSIEREDMPVIANENVAEISKISNAEKEESNSSIISDTNISSIERENSSVIANENVTEISKTNNATKEESNSSIISDTNISSIEREDTPVIANENVTEISKINNAAKEENNSSIISDTNTSSIERKNTPVVANENVTNSHSSQAMNSNSSNVSNPANEMENAEDEIINSTSIINTESTSSPTNNSTINSNNTSNNVAIDNSVKTNQSNTTTSRPSTNNVSTSRPSDNEVNTSSSMNTNASTKPNTTTSNSNIRIAEPQNAAAIQMPTAPVRRPARPSANLDSGGRILKTIKFIDEDSGLPIQGEVDIKTPSGMLTLTSNANGEVQIPATAQNKGEADIFAYGYFYQNETIDKTNNKQTFKLKRVANGNKIALKNLFFQSGTSEILPASFPELERLYQSMISNSDIKVEVGGHINVPFTRPEDITSRQQQISVDRAKAVYEYLKSKGIPKNRLEYKGYGNSEMVFPQAQTDAEKTQNRRVEIKIVR